MHPTSSYKTHINASFPGWHYCTYGPLRCALCGVNCILLTSFFLLLLPLAWLEIFRILCFFVTVIHMTTSCKTKYHTDNFCIIYFHSQLFSRSAGVLFTFTVVFLLKENITFSCSYSMHLSASSTRHSVSCPSVYLHLWPKKHHHVVGAQDYTQMVNWQSV